MYKKTILVLMSLILVFAGFSLASAQEVKNPDTFTYATSGNINTLDPSFGYDSESIQACTQVYENLIRYKGESIKEFEPLLASKVPTVENGLISEDGLTYKFPIRKGVEFSNGNKLTPEDVKYSFMRSLIQNRSGGPTWMLYEPLLGVHGLSALSKKVVGVEDPKKLTPAQSAEVYGALDKHIKIQDNMVVFHLAQPYPPFMQILSQSAAWSAIMDKEWCIAQGCWDGSVVTIPEYYDVGKEDDPLYDKMMGTGPFVLEEWVKGDRIVFKRNDNYWGEKANFETAIIRYVDEYSTRKLMLQRGDADRIYAPRQYLDQLKQMDGVVVKTGHPELQDMAGIMNWEINPKGNEAVGSGKLDGKGIPPKFFADENVRKAFSYAFNYKAFIDQVRKGLADRLRGPIVKPLLGYDENSEVIKHNMEKAKEHFQKAFDGELWEKGFEMTVLYNTGNTSRKIASDILKTYVEQVNDKFDIKVRGVQWSTYLDTLLQGKFTLGFIGWSVDFPDPHNFVTPHMASDGTFGGWKGEAYKKWAQENIDPLIEEGLTTIDKDEREEIYKEIQKLAVENATDLWIDQPSGNVIMRDWVKGWYPNPMHPDVVFYKLDK